MKPSDDEYSYCAASKRAISVCYDYGSFVGILSVDTKVKKRPK